MWSEEKLNELLTTPSEKLVEDIAKIKGDIMVLGAGGKMGPTLCILAKNAVKAAGIDKKVIAVSRYSDASVVELLENADVEVIKCDLQEKDQLNALPDCENIIYMAGKKFGTDGNEWATWGMNSVLPAMVIDKFRGKTFVVFSSGNIYPIVPIHTGGCDENVKVEPKGEYTMSCLARERTFEYGAKKYGSKVFMYRLNYAVDLRYGVLYDIANNVLNEKPISLTTPNFNIIWQGSANEIAIRGLLYATEDVCTMNVTGPETMSIRKTAEQFGEIFGKKPVFSTEETNTAYLSDASKSAEIFGYPAVSAQTLIKWQAEWILSGGRGLGKPTHFEERGGSY